MVSRVSRRDLGRLAAGLVAARALPADAQPPPAPTYAGPLTGIDRALDDRGFDPVAFARELYVAAPRRLRFQATTRADARSWQSDLRAKITELVGGFPAARTPLRPVDARDANVRVVSAREDRVRQPAWRQRAGVRAASRHAPQHRRCR